MTPSGFFSALNGMCIVQNASAENTAAMHKVSAERRFGASAGMTRLRQAKSVKK